LSFLTSTNAKNHEVVNSNNERIEGINEIKGLDYLVVITFDMTVYAYDSSLVEQHKYTMPATFGDLEHVAWQPNTIFFTLSSYGTINKVNILTWPDLCHENCGTCTLLPTATQ
jgi:hypothetical protein